MKKLRKKKIEKLRNGEIAIHNVDGTLEELNQILKEAFGYDSSPSGISKYYKRHRINDWVGEEDTTSQSYPISYFFKEKKGVKDEPLKICGYRVKKIEGDYKIGCKTIRLRDLLRVSRVMEVNHFKTVQFDEYKVTLEEINKILEL